MRPGDYVTLSVLEAEPLAGGLLRFMLTDHTPNPAYAAQDEEEEQEGEEGGALGGDGEEEGVLESEGEGTGGAGEQKEGAVAAADVA